MYRLKRTEVVQEVGTRARTELPVTTINDPIERLERLPTMQYSSQL